MFYFDGHCEPPTAFELRDVQNKLKSKKKQQLIYSCLSDLIHGLLFWGLYYFDLLSGRATLTAVIFASVCALALANSVHQPLSRSDKLSIGATGIGMLFANLLLLIWWLKQPIYPSTVASLAGCSIVFIGAHLGCKVKHVIHDLEDLKPVYDDCPAKQELANMTSRFPEVATYREQARQILRPNLTYGELKAMRSWCEKRRAD